ncbi:hypothetical protein B0H14DRAFT_2561901 [Mycena olivaceomarginata]|nr:hypothetical protein B0H14DRAFT_2561901 [Mycena olivaceomarginata]
MAWHPMLKQVEDPSPGSTVLYKFLTEMICQESLYHSELHLSRLLSDIAIRSSKNGLATTNKPSTREKDIGSGALTERTQKGHLAHPMGVQSDRYCFSSSHTQFIWKPIVLFRAHPGVLKLEFENNGLDWCSDNILYLTNLETGMTTLFSGYDMLSSALSLPTASPSTEMAPSKLKKSGISDQSDQPEKPAPKSEAPSETLSTVNLKIHASIQLRV